ncbi:MAG TPA: hypothetical protein VJ349_08590 [Stellaceae bacterium]|nr:hypothetical protein [Stellaceae bacterium]
MSKLLFLARLITASLMLFSTQAEATEQVDFKAAINKGFVADSAPFTPPALPRLVSTTVYTTVGLSSRGSVTVLYQVVEDNNNTTLFSQMVTLNTGQTTVTFGKDKAGKLVLTYDVSTEWASGAAAPESEREERLEVAFSPACCWPSQG